MKKKKIARAFDYQDPRDPSDTRDRFELPDYEQRDKDGRFAERGQPFTQAEIDAYLECGGAITICPTLVHPQSKPPGLTKAQISWAEEFHPLVGIWADVDACRRHLDIIRPTSPQNAARRLRAREIVKGVLQGWTFADVAVELCLDKGFLSRKVAEIYAEYPKLERSLIFVNLLNNQAKRHKQSTPWAFSYRGERKIRTEPRAQRLIRFHHIIRPMSSLLNYITGRSPSRALTMERWSPSISTRLRRRGPSALNTSSVIAGVMNSAPMIIGLRLPVIGTTRARGMQSISGVAYASSRG